MIKEVRVYDGPESLGDIVSTIKLDDYIFPSVDYKPSKKYDKDLDFPVSSIIIKYPLNVKAEIIVSGVKTINDLLSDIVKGYQEIYRMEENSTVKKASRICDEIPSCPLINRGRTDGLFGIWGHFIGDLAIHTINLHKSGYLTLRVDS